MDPNDSKLHKRASALPLPPVDAAPQALSPFKAYPAGPGHRFFTDGTFQQRVETQSRSRARIFDLGHGQIEAIVQPVIDWVEVESLSPHALAAAIASQHLLPPLTADELLERAERNEDRSCRRARTKVRRLAKYKRLDTMLTLTYRENQTDRTLAQAHLSAFLRRVKKLIPGFEYVAVAELQDRGAYHWHLAVKRLNAGYFSGGYYVHSWKLLRAIWRSVIGGGGNIDVQAPGKPGRGIHKLAGYLTKYITKGFTSGVKHQNRYQASGCDLPRAVVVDLPCVGMGAVHDVYRLLLAEWAGGRHYTSPPLASGGYFISITPS